MINTSDDNFSKMNLYITIPSYNNICVQVI